MEIMKSVEDLSIKQEKKLSVGTLVDPNKKDASEETKIVFPAWTHGLTVGDIFMGEKASFENWWVLDNNASEIYSRTTLLLDINLLIYKTIYWLGRLYVWRGGFCQDRDVSYRGKNVFWWCHLYIYKQGDSIEVIKITTTKVSR